MAAAALPEKKAEAQDQKAPIIPDHVQSADPHFYHGKIGRLMRRNAEPIAYWILLPDHPPDVPSVFYLFAARTSHKLKEDQPVWFRWGVADNGKGQKTVQAYNIHLEDPRLHSPVAPFKGECKHARSCKRLQEEYHLRQYSHYPLTPLQHAELLSSGATLQQETGTILTIGDASNNWLGQIQPATGGPPVVYSLALRANVTDSTKLSPGVAVKYSRFRNEAIGVLVA